MTNKGDNSATTRRYLEELLACRGVEEEVVLRSRFGFMAFHGGSLEQHTDPIATAAAAACDASVYVVRQPTDLRWHIPSTLFRTEESEKLTAFFSHVDIVITIHGYRRKAFPRHLLLGGRNRALARHVASYLEPALPDYEIEHGLDNIPEPIRGVHPDNPVNVPRHNGVQIELPHKIRGAHPFWETSRGKAGAFQGDETDPDRLVAALAASVRSYSI